ncbi:unnamed protein product, partial [Amoebophrya sp. A25]|eukprot:GSA25T00005068001.1
MVSLHGRVLDENQGILYRKDPRNQTQKAGVVSTSLDILRLLFQRDHLFLYLSNRHFHTSSSAARLEQTNQTSDTYQNVVMAAMDGANFSLPYQQQQLQQQQRAPQQAAANMQQKKTFVMPEIVEQATSVDNLLLLEYPEQWPPEDYAVPQHDFLAAEHAFVPRTGTFGDRLKRNFHQYFGNTPAPARLPGGQLAGSVYSSSAGVANGGVKGMNSGAGGVFTDADVDQRQPNNLTLILFYIMSQQPRLCQIAKKAVFVLHQMISRNALAVAHTLELYPILREGVSYGLAHNMFELAAYDSGATPLYGASVTNTDLSADFLAESRQYADTGFAQQAAYSVVTGFSLVQEVEARTNVHDDIAVENLDLLLVRLLRRPVNTAAGRGSSAGLFSQAGSSFLALQNLAPAFYAGVPGGPGSGSAMISATARDKLTHFGREKTLRAAYLQDSTLNCSAFGFETGDDERIFEILDRQHREAENLAVASSNNAMLSGFGGVGSAAGIPRMGCVVATPGRPMTGVVPPLTGASAIFGPSGRTPGATPATTVLNGGTPGLTATTPGGIGLQQQGTPGFRTARRVPGVAQHVGPSGDLQNLTGMQEHMDRAPQQIFAPGVEMPLFGPSIELTKYQKEMLHMCHSDRPNRLFPHTQKHPALDRTPLRELVLLLLRECLHGLSRSSGSLLQLSNVATAVPKKSDSRGDVKMEDVAPQQKAKLP